MEKHVFRCVECNEKATELHRDYSNGILKITICIHWKLCVFCLLCEAYLRWSLLPGSEQSSDPADIIRYTKEWEFYGMFGLAALELSAFCSTVLWFIWLVVGRLQGGTVEISLLLRALLLSCYGKVLLIPAVIWEHDYSPLCLGLIKLFVLTSNSQAIRVILNSSRRLSLMAICLGVLSETCVGQACKKLQWSIQDMVKFE
ncbi:protein ARV1 isoform X2 [Mastacembelus armatus]|uniref:protein ARV1 isoform X2 n=1 Tax=Mastacembelus armatus TaxID=205130 RepID=UPI000E45BC3D|nr:protein ARV1 isoform X2 [Mastacembelus armatus]